MKIHSLILIPLLFLACSDPVENENSAENVIYYYIDVPAQDSSLYNFLYKETDHKLFEPDSTGKINCVAASKNSTVPDEEISHYFILYHDSLSLKHDRINRIIVTTSADSTGRNIVHLEMKKFEGNSWQNLMNAGDFKIPSDFEMQNGKKNFTPDEYHARIKELILKIAFK
jgi:hypothetical protein